jgi:hypothetical protein
VHGNQAGCLRCLSGSLESSHREGAAREAEESEAMAGGNTATPVTVRQIAAAADFRNWEPAGQVRGLARLEKLFREMVIAEGQKSTQTYADIRALCIGRKIAE